MLTPSLFPKTDPSVFDAAPSDAAAALADVFCGVAAAVSFLCLQTMTVGLLRDEYSAERQNSADSVEARYLPPRKPFLLSRLDCIETVQAGTEKNLS